MKSVSPDRECEKCHTPITPSKKLDPWTSKKEKFKSSECPAKKFIDANSLLVDSFALAKKIYETGFRPTFIVALWRGGSLIGCAVQEYFEHHKVATNHFAVRTAHYSNTEIDKANVGVKVFGLEYIMSHAESEDRLLIIDDVFDTGESATAVKKELKRLMRKNTPKIEIGVVYYKPNRRNKNITPPKFYLRETDDWLVFPHELGGLNDEEIKKKGEDVFEMVK